MQDEFYATSFRKKIYNHMDELQTDLNIWLAYDNNERPHTDKHWYGKSSIETCYNSFILEKEMLLSNHYPNVGPLLLSGELKAAAAGEQPVRNSLTDRDTLGVLKSPSN